jgi:polysaccharide biosynthesis/export protein
MAKPRLKIAAPLYLVLVTQAGLAAELTSANLPAQRLGPNDLVAVSVYDAPELTRTVRVGADGYLQLPMLKRRIQAEGLMPGELEDAIATSLRAEQLIVDPLVTVSIAEYSSRPISVAGAVKQPVTFQAAAPVTLLEALTRAGGLSPEAGPEILVSHTPQGAATPQTRRIPVKGLMNAADPAFNLALTGGEQIRVPQAGKVYVVGTVRKPGAFAIEDGARSTVLKMLALSEGLMPFAAAQAYIYRQEGAGRTREIPVPLHRILERKAPDVPLVANDIFYVPDNKGRRLTLGAIEKVLIYGASAATAGIYAGVR